MKFKDALLAVVSSERRYHPVKEYLSALKWDGKERIDTLLVDYMGAEDTPYVRAVTRKMLCAAVARIYEPGIKFDSMLVLNGPQGMGKSTFYAILGKQWFSDSLSIADMRDKTAAEKLQGYWILEIAEMNGIKKVDVETVKSFLSRTDDKFRQAYGTVVESHPRTNIIVGSSNSESGFLRDVTGNRRFWPVNVSGKGAHHPWELTEVDQVWAEAIERYHAGEELFLKGSVAEEAYLRQQEAMESDDREGLVQDYLDRLLPPPIGMEWTSTNAGVSLAVANFPGLLPPALYAESVSAPWKFGVSAFCKERQNLKRTDSYEIEGILTKIGWSVTTANKHGKTRFPLYGPQRTFVRNKAVVAGNTNIGSQ